MGMLWSQLLGQFSDGEMAGRQQQRIDLVACQQQDLGDRQDSSPVARALDAALQPAFDLAPGDIRQATQLLGADFPPIERWSVSANVLMRPPRRAWLGRDSVARLFKVKTRKGLSVVSRQYWRLTTDNR